MLRSPLQNLKDEVQRLAQDAPSGAEIMREVLEVGRLLLEKNAQYGDSALEPIGMMSGADAVEAIDVRLDDKFSRLKRGVNDDPEDVLLDIIGYIVLRRIASNRQEDKNADA